MLNLLNKKRARQEETGLEYGAAAMSLNTDADEKHYNTKLFAGEEENDEESTVAILGGGGASNSVGEGGGGANNSDGDDIASEVTVDRISAMETRLFLVENENEKLRQQIDDLKNDYLYERVSVLETVMMRYFNKMASQASSTLNQFTNDSELLRDVVVLLQTGQFLCQEAGNAISASTPVDPYEPAY